uniref:Integrin-alpha FG-GAP repeat-containing protein 2 n=1 Tax=Hymenolepis diminuta TaxID=6216 RepID=A0A0R3S8X0_HYMDI
LQIRNITFVDRIEIPNATTTTSTNLYLYDVDNDGDVELLVGHWDLGELDPGHEPICPNGSLLIFKYGKMWKSYRDLNMVTCVTAGLLCFSDKPSVVVLCADSGCYIFDATVNTSDSQPKLIHTQQIACNAKDARILEGDGSCDVVVAYSDRIVRLYKWVPGNSEANLGELVLLIKWELAGQISRISLHSTPDQNNLMLASQPGGGFAFLPKKFESYDGRVCPTLVYHPPKQAPHQNSETRTWIVGDLKTRSHNGIERTIGICLADGTMHLVTADLQKSETIWTVNLPVNGELFGLSKFDLTGDGIDELAVCCWDGSTYIFNYDRDVLHFPLAQSCQAFTAGSMATSPGRNEPVLIYSTCQRSILIYYNLDVQSIPAYSLMLALNKRKDLLERLKEFSGNCKTTDCIISRVQYNASFSLNLRPFIFEHLGFLKPIFPVF